MDIKDFPCLIKTFTHNETLYFEGLSKDGKRILVSKKKDQWILTINSIYYIVAISDNVPDEIKEALICIINNVPVDPNKMALFLRTVTQQKE
jgi:hypothetical protein